MYALQPMNEQERLVGEDPELADDASDRESQQQVQICRAVRHGLLAVAVFGFIGLACLHLSGSQALKSSVADPQVKAGIYGNGAWGAQPAAQTQAAPTAAVATPAVAVPAVAAPVTAAPVAAPAIEIVTTEPEHAVINKQINSVNELTGGTGVSKIVSAQSANNPLAPSENLADGNECSDDEEEFQGMCYKQCAILTNGEMTKRVSAFECSKEAGFMGVFKGKTEGFPMPCQGFDVAGDEAGGGCPHKKGACLKDEELYLGKCFKKCSSLTGNKYMIRTGAETCCSSENVFACMSPTNTKFSPDFNVGGGMSSKESQPHSPEVKLTEAR
ncbi:unnamed protein product [Symbiodinium pilosum]|uniref:Uncharacterized protein n=1 Tax=Symbiodinium pilosum TaxID=2952 RepID=A0A812KEM3_SYMPI|nr:unnamed protein product [Symbiodinium pilosum]